MVWFIFVLVCFALFFQQEEIITKGRINEGDTEKRWEKNLMSCKIYNILFLVVKQIICNVHTVSV